MKEKIFLTKWSEISGNRWDPKYINYQKRTKFFRYKPVELKKLILQEPMYGANEPSCERKSIKEPRYIRITDIDEFGNLKDEIGVTAKVIEKKYFLNENDLLFARSGATVGKTYIHKKKDYDCFFAGYLIKFVIDESKVDPNFIFYYTQLDIYKEWVKAIQRTSAQPNINAEEYKSLPIPLPPKTIQRKIIQKMENAYKQKEKAEQKAQELLNSIDDYILKELGIELPKIEEKDIKQRVFIRKWSEVSGNRWDSEYYSSKYYIKHLILNKQKNLVMLKDIATIFQGVSKNEVKGSSFILLKVKNILSGNSIDYNNVEFIKDVPKEKLLLKGDIITPFIGEAIKQFKFSVFDNLENKYTVDNNTGIIRINKQNVEPNYVCEILNSVLVRWQIEQQIGGGGVPFIGASGAKKIKIPLPNIDKQRKIVNRIHKMREEANKLTEQALENLENTKKEIEKMLLKEKNDI